MRMRNMMRFPTDIIKSRNRMLNVLGFGAIIVHSVDSLFDESGIYWLKLMQFITLLLLWIFQIGIFILILKANK